MGSDSRIDRILVIGAGMAGLLAALLLSGEGREVIVLERDPPPPGPGAAAEGGEADADHAFGHWRRPGVGQLRHSHAFLARLVNILRDRHPALIDQLKAAGCREMALADLLPSTLKDRYAPEPGDAAMSLLMSRRTTFEFVVRQYVEGLGGVRIRSGEFIDGLVFAEGAGTPTVAGVRTQAGETIAAEVVIDAGGRCAQAVDWLGAAGVATEQSGAPAGILYYTRHWRLRPGQDRPARSRSPSAADLGYLQFGLFEADNGWFSVTLAAPEVETELRGALIRPEGFDRACRALPGVAAWIEPQRSAPETKVFAMGELKSLWRRLVKDGRPTVLGLFLIGDSLIQSNPLYGRGTAFAAVEAEALARALSAGRDAAGRAILYDSLVDQALRPYYDDMQEQDRAAIRRARAARAGETASVGEQLLQSFMRDGAGLAVRDDLSAFRAALRAFHMLDPPRAWLFEPRHVELALRTWARGKRRNAHLYPDRAGPGRMEMLSHLDLTCPPGASDSMAA